MAVVGVLYVEGAVEALRHLSFLPAPLLAYPVSASDIPAAIARASRTGFDMVVVLGDHDAHSSRAAGIALGFPTVIQVRTKPSACTADCLPLR
jgi:hypothetical protein